MMRENDYTRLLLEAQRNNSAALKIGKKDSMPHNNIIKQNYYINSVGRKVPLYKKEGNLNRHPQRYYDQNMSYRWHEAFNVPRIKKGEGNSHTANAGGADEQAERMH